MTDVVMPQMGESITEGTLTKWLKRPGEQVAQDEALFEISTDKVDTEIPSPAAGVLAEVLVEEGATVAINTVVARIDGESGAKAAPEATAGDTAPVPEAAEEEEEGEMVEAAEQSAPAETPAEQPAQAPEDEKAAPPPPAEGEPAGPLSPLVRRLAREHNIDLRQVKGTGAGGRITKADVEAYLASRAPAAAPAPPPAAPKEAPAPRVEAPPPAREAEPLPRPAPAKARVEPMSNMRQKIAEHMVFSKRTSAHVTTVHQCDMTKIARLRDSAKKSFQERYGFSLTYMPFVTRAAAQALREHPIVNASVEGTNILYHNEINIGVAVALENGLIVPVIRRADEMSIVGLQRAIVDLAHRARSRQLKPDEVQGGTFSITNFGSFGSLFATPVINQPQIGILGVGAVVKQPVVVDDAIAIRSMCYLALTFDHRLIDGALADQFTGRVRQILENWSEQAL
ncbi:MAG: 2-oxoglutarate dehydrogenase, E2 component, dihydrolipoamide succinyltransferase [Bryobacteraceae bacterium]|nr:2-oxoglutarate dehydrogenase, E2 component, dihydrolipoamide succinyltransferase [Bryobacteraceae bacterium]